MKKIGILLLLSLFVASATYAETMVSPVVSFSTDFMGGFGMKEPGFSIGGGLEISSPVVWINASGSFNPNDKAIYGNTDSISGGFSALGRFPGGIVAGGGLSYTELEFVDLGLTKTALRPRATVGWENGRYRALFSYFYSANDESSHMDGFSVSVEAYLTSKLRWKASVVHGRFDRISFRPELGRTAGSGARFSITWLPLR